MREAGELPPQALDVTAACAFMVEGGQLRFHGGVAQHDPSHVPYQSLVAIAQQRCLFDASRTP